MPRAIRGRGRRVGPVDRIAFVRDGDVQTGTGVALDVLDRRGVDVLPGVALSFLASFLSGGRVLTTDFVTDDALTIATQARQPLFPASTTVDGELQFRLDGTVASGLRVAVYTVHLPGGVVQLRSLSLAPQHERVPGAAIDRLVYDWAPNGRVLVAALHEGQTVLAPDLSVRRLLDFARGRRLRAVSRGHPPGLEPRTSSTLVCPSGGQRSRPRS